MTGIESFEIVLFISDFQLFCSEKLLRILSQNVLHCAAKTGSFASFIRSSRLHAQNTITKTTANIKLKHILINLFC